MKYRKPLTKLLNMKVNYLIDIVTSDERLSNEGIDTSVTSYTRTIRHSAAIKINEEGHDDVSMLLQGSVNDVAKPKMIHFLKDKKSHRKPNKSKFIYFKQCT